MKRIVSVLLSVVLILSLATVSFAADNATITVASVTAEDGVANVTISLSNNPGITSMLLSVTYDSALTLTGVTDAGQLGTPLHSTQAVDLENNPYTLLWNDFLAKDDHRVNGAIVTLKFKVNDGTKPGDYAISVSYNEDNVANSDGDNVPFAVVNGKVTVKGTTCTHSNNKHYDPVAATCMAAGNIEYWVCNDCHKIFSDKACTTEESVISIAQKSHSYTGEMKNNGDGTHSYKCVNGCNEYGNAKGHDTTGAWTPCTNEDAHYQECGCGNIVKEAHTWGDWETTQEPTCKAEGSKTRTCSKCNATESESIDKASHTLHGNLAIDPTCTTSGHNAYFACIVCDKVFKDESGTIETTVSAETIPATGHNWGEWEVVEAATETHPGSSKRVCQNDSKHVENKEIPQRDHTHVFDQQNTDSKYLASAAACTTPATYYYSCTCGEKGTETFEFGDVRIHNYVENPSAATLLHEATCTYSAIYYTSCEYCGYKGTDTFQYGDTAPHDYDTAWTTDGSNHWHACKKCSDTTGLAAHVYDQEVASDEFLATPGNCTTPNTYYKSCICGAKGTDTFEDTAPGHTWSDVTVTTPPTCTKAGKGTHYCTKCGNADSPVECDIPALDHDYVDNEAKPATCTEAGWNAYQTCSRCDYSDKVEIRATGHTPGTEIAEVPATCVAAGTKAHYECTVCHKTLVKDANNGYNEATADDLLIPVDPDAHDLEHHNAQNPTCTEGGWEAYQTCSRCDYTTYAPISALGHRDAQYTEAKLPTCTTDGNNEYYTCSACGKFFSDADCTHEISEDSRVIPALGHDWGEWVVVTPATYDAEGSRQHACKRCQITEDEVIPKLVRPVVPADDPTPTRTETQSPKTADAGIMLYAGMSVMSLLGMGWVAKKRHD